MTVFDIIDKEKKRQASKINLIASENFVSDRVMQAVGSCLTNKYAEGYPNRRYYGGCEVVDELETYCQEKWRQVFNTDYHVNVQPHSGSNANLAAYLSVLDVGDTVLSLSLNNGGHLTHGSSINISGKLYNFAHYKVDADGYIDYDNFERCIRFYAPKLIVAGASAYPRRIDFRRMYDIINRVKGDIQQTFGESYNLYFMVDMSHIAGLVACDLHPSPFGYADIITTTTHKTLRGARGGLIFCKPELAYRIDKAVFPCLQGGALMHSVAGKAAAAEECLTPEYWDYMRQVQSNAKAMCERFKQLGYDVVTGGTDTHLFLLDFSKTHPNLSGKDVQEALERHNIIVNKNMVPHDRRNPQLTSGIRIGTPAMTTKGMKEDWFVKLAELIDKIIAEANKAKSSG